MLLKENMKTKKNMPLKIVSARLIEATGFRLEMSRSAPGVHTGNIKTCLLGRVCHLFV